MQRNVAWAVIIKVGRIKLFVSKVIWAFSTENANNSCKQNILQSGIQTGSQGGSKNETRKKRGINSADNQGYQGWYNQTLAWTTFSATSVCRD